MSKLSLAAIAAEYHKTPKTFSRHVKAVGIPHEKIGRSMVFDLGKVSAFLEALAASERKVKAFPLPVKKNRRKLVNTEFKSRFAEAL